MATRKARRERGFARATSNARAAFCSPFDWREGTAGSVCAEAPIEKSRRAKERAHLRRRGIGGPGIRESFPDNRRIQTSPQLVPQSKMRAWGEPKLFCLRRLADPQPTQREHRGPCIVSPRYLCFNYTIDVDTISE